LVTGVVLLLELDAAMEELLGGVLEEDEVVALELLARLLEETAVLELLARELEETATLELLARLLEEIAALEELGVVVPPQAPVLENFM
jgi:hypothetical protein